MSPNRPTGSPSAPTFAELLRSLGETIEARSRSLETPGLSREVWEIRTTEDAVTAVLTHVVAVAVPSAPDLLRGRASVEEATAPIVFLYFCAFPLSVALKREGQPLDVGAIVNRAAVGMLESYPPEARARILRDAQSRVRELMRLPRTHVIGQWLNAVGQLMTGAIESRDPGRFGGLTHLYAIFPEVVSAPADDA